ncbi:ABC transporter permease [Paenibacillus soyae]|uniref:FtsX-like permease family protein n=1 Tax=Paenibacillus soyae TaxID=2969249 RepID=A0A9X2SDZ4_9BACL|nr:FtsX-like permease family protein [Paenibacillus soyae]MCR2807637.1 FtsX-like permease family protein [Paenibacillus soyae]
MKFQDQIRFVRQNMKKNKTRLFMTVLATAMGCTFLIVLASVGFGLQQSMVDNIVGDRLVTAVDLYGKNPDQHKDTNIYDEDIQMFRELADVKAVTYRNNIYQWLNPKVEGEEVGSDKTTQVDFEAETKAGFDLSAGRMPEADNEIVIGYHIREQMDEQGMPTGYEDASEWLNKTMTLEVTYYAAGKKLTEPMEAVIVGVTEIPTKEWNRDKTIYMGVGMLEKIEGITGTRNGELPYFEVENPTAEKIDAALANLPKPSEQRSYQDVQVVASHAEKVKGLVETLRDKGFYTHSIVDELKQVNLMFAIMKIGLIFVGTIAVLIASIGIFNTMTMAVTERAQDIGIMKAIGAHPSVIRKLFLLESAMIGLMGAIFGTVVAYGVSLAVNAGLPVVIKQFMEEEVPADFLFSVIPPYLTALACGISLGVAMLSGYRPALRATRIDVLSALRRDV